MKQRLKRTLTTCISFLFLALMTMLAAAASAATPVPRIAGPVPMTKDSYAFGAAAYERTPEDLAKVGYVEEEFLASGTANVYDWPGPGPAVVRAANAPYTTRVLVRRPANRGRFGGLVIVEMLNPSNLFDLNLGWAISHKEIIRRGSVWVGITVKPVSVVTLKAFNPARYAPLSLANPVPLDDARNCATVASDSARTTENGLAWDMYSQVAAWIRSRDRSNPVLYGVAAGAAHPVRRVYAWGYSQTGSYLYTYVNAIHPLVVAADGKPMFDAFLIAVAIGAPTAINQCAPAIPNGDPRRMIRDAGVPVIRVMSGSDYLSGIAGRRPDSDAPADRFRNYEVAGSAHATPDELFFAAAPADIEKGGRLVPPMSCNEGPRSRFPNGPAFNAILRNLDEWVRTGKPAPHVDPILVKGDAPALDAYGNVTGGIRSPMVDVPTSRWISNATGPSFCRIAGYEQPFDAARLLSLYPTPKAYVDAVQKNVTGLVAARQITREDGDDLVRDARAFAAEHLVRH